MGRAFHSPRKVLETDSPGIPAAADTPTLGAAVAVLVAAFAVARKVLETDSPGVSAVADIPTLGAAVAVLVAAFAVEASFPD